MKISKRDGSLERKVLIGLIVDAHVLGKIASRWREGLFKTKWANLVAKWCVDYYNQYSKAPKADIENLFISWASTYADKDTVQLVDKFLSGLDQEYEHLEENINSDYLIDQAGKHFNAVQLQRLSETIAGDIDRGHIEEASKRVVDYSLVEVGNGSGVDVFNDKEALKAAADLETKPLIKYTEALYHFFLDAFVPDSFIAALAPEKRGKTFWLTDIAWRGIEQGKNVAFFSVGDMSERQMMRRLMSRATERPFKAKKKYNIPTMFEKEPGSAPVYSFKAKRTTTSLKAVDAYKAFKAHRKKHNLRPDCLKLSTHPNDSISVKGVEAILQQWERDGWVADVVVIDYADILAMPDGGTETRDKINSTWKQLRALSQRRHVCLVTATQADAASYEVASMNMTNFSEDKRKFSHVTGMFGINQTDEEKRAQQYRLNWIVLRESDYDVSKEVHVIGCLDIGQPAIFSVF